MNATPARAGDENLRTVRLPQGQLEYLDTGGDGPAVVFLHGVLMDHGLWTDVVERLAPAIRCLVPILPLGAHRRPMPRGTDLRPAGLADLVATFVLRLRLVEATVVGNDTGGAIAQLLVTRHPGAAAAVVLVSCDAYDNFPPGLPGRTMALAAAVPGGLNAAVATLRLKPLRRLPMTFGWMAKRPIDDRLFTRWLDAYAAGPGVRRDLRRFMAGVDRRQLTAAAGELPRFPGGALVVWAKEDKVMPRRHADGLAAALDAGTVVEVDDSFTLVPLDQPDRLAAAIWAFVRDRGPASDRGVAPVAPPSRHPPNG